MFKAKLEELIVQEFTASAMTEEEFMLYARLILRVNFSRTMLREARLKNNIPINRRGTAPFSTWVPRIKM